MYDIAKYRWCENVQRFHKSNNIMWVNDVQFLPSKNTFCFWWWWVICLPLIWLFPLGSLRTWKRKFGTRSVMTPNARTSDPPVCANAKNLLTILREIVHANKHWDVTGYPLPQEICVGYIMTMVSDSISNILCSFSTWPTVSALGGRTMRTRRT